MYCQHHIILMDRGGLLILTILTLLNYRLDKYLQYKKYKIQKPVELSCWLQRENIENTYVL